MAKISTKDKDSFEGNEIGVAARCNIPVWVWKCSEDKWLLWQLSLTTALASVQDNMSDHPFILFGRAK